MGIKKTTVLIFKSTVTFFQLPQLKAMENPEEFEIDDEGPEISEEEYQKSLLIHLLY